MEERYKELTVFVLPEGNSSLIECLSASKIHRQHAKELEKCSFGHDDMDGICGSPDL